MKRPLRERSVVAATRMTHHDVLAQLHQSFGNGQFLNELREQLTGDLNGMAASNKAWVACVGMTTCEKQERSEPYDVWAERAGRVPLRDAGIGFDAIQQAYGATRTLLRLWPL